MPSRTLRCPRSYPGSSCSCNRALEWGAASAAIMPRLLLPLRQCRDPFPSKSPPSPPPQRPDPPRHLSHTLEEEVWPRRSNSLCVSWVALDFRPTLPRPQCSPTSPMAAATARGQRPYRHPRRQRPLSRCCALPPSSSHPLPPLLPLAGSQAERCRRRRRPHLRSRLGCPLQQRSSSSWLTCHMAADSTRPRRPTSAVRAPLQGLWEQPRFPRRQPPAGQHCFQPQQPLSLCRQPSR